MCRLCVEGFSPLENYAVVLDSSKTVVNNTRIDRLIDMLYFHIGRGHEMLFWTECVIVRNHHHSSSIIICIQYEYCTGMMMRSAKRSLLRVAWSEVQVSGLRSSSYVSHHTVI
jgi:hypothetical protein